MSRVARVFVVICAAWGCSYAFSPVRHTPSSLRYTSLRMTVPASLPLVEPFGKGLLEDIKRKSLHYKSDITDGFTVKSLSAIVFLFFACLAPAIAFGGLLGFATNGQTGRNGTLYVTHASYKTFRNASRGPVVPIIVNGWAESKA